MRWALWWFAVFAAYVITVDTQNASEIIAGAIIAVPCSWIALAAFRNGSPGVRVHWRDVRHLGSVPMRMVGDALLVSRRILWALASGERLTGYIMRLPYDPGDRDSEWSLGREALAIYGISAGPNSVVLDVDLRGELVLHKLVASEQSAESEQWPL
jgi:hypothetical protein